MIKYFLYSHEQFKEKNLILAKSNKEFVPGVVIVNGVRKNFTALSSTPTLPRYFDTQVVASGEIENFTYTRPFTVKKVRS